MNLGLLDPRVDTPIDWVSPVNWLHPLAHNLVGFWLEIPGAAGGPVMVDVTRRHPGNFSTITSFDRGFGEGLPFRSGVTFGTANGVVLCGTSMLLEPSTYSAATWCLWATPRVSQNGRALLTKNDVSDSTYNFFETLTAPDRWRSSGGTTLTYPDGSLVAGQTSFLARSWNGATVSAFLDGKLAAGPSAQTSLTTNRSAQHLRIGNNNTNGPFDGKIQAVMVYRNRGLSDLDIKTLYEIGRRGFPGLINRVRRVFVPVAAGGGGATAWFELKPPGGSGSAGTIWSLKP